MTFKFYIFWSQEYTYNLDDLTVFDLHLLLFWPSRPCRKYPRRSKNGYVVKKYVNTKQLGKMGSGGIIP